LDWMNKEHIKKLPLDTVRGEIVLRLKKSEIFAKSDKFNDDHFMTKISNIISDHISKWSDVDTMVGAGELSYYFEIPEYEPSLLSWKDSTPEDSKRHLEWLKNKLLSAESSDFDSADKIKNLIFDYATLNGKGNVLWPLRVALSGLDKSPDPFTLLYVFNKEESIIRISNAIEKI
jgi:glutamyl/glutaminyl-tRNA synthetase